LESCYEFIIPIVAQRLRNQKSLVSVTFILSIIGGLGLISGGTSFLTLSVIMIGLANGAGFALALSFFGLRSSNPQETAVLSGMAQSKGYFLAAATPALFGYLHDLTDSWNLSLIILVGLSFIQLIVGFGAGKDVVVTPKGEARKVF
jgi:MFS transporter, CP family, cyanate transporter